MRLKKNIAISESGFIFNPGTGDSYSLNQIGIEIFDMLKQGKTDSEITQELLEKYEVDRVSIDKYYYDFLAMLLQYQLIDDNGKD
jgi:hypothetical protein